MPSVFRTPSWNRQLLWLLFFIFCVQNDIIFMQLFEMSHSLATGHNIICLRVHLENLRHYVDVITMASQITSLTDVYSTVYSDADQRKHQSSASLAFCVGNSPGPVNSPHKGLVTRKMFPFDDVIMDGDVCIYVIKLNDTIWGFGAWDLAWFPYFFIRPKPVITL